MGKFYRRDFSEIFATSHHCLLTVRNKMAVLIANAEERLDILYLAIAILSEPVQAPQTIAQLEILTDMSSISVFQQTPLS